MSVEFTWNNRVIRFVDPWGDVCYFFAEVTYDENGKPDGYSEEVCMVGDDIEELHLILDRLRTALTQPILEAKDFPQNQRKNVAGQIVEPPKRNEWVDWKWPRNKGE